MIRQKLYIPRYNWTAWCYYAVDDFYVNEIASHLHSLGCEEFYLDRAVQNMRSRSLNHGFTYSNNEQRQSVLVIGLTSSSPQFLNSLTHELYHLALHISTVTGIDLHGEEGAYLIGDTAQATYPFVRHLLCEHCREKLLN